ncbi:glycosyltransferase family 2 protein [Paenibacillus sp. NEAU-GSW1]|uniref:glycosyltransferase family 2 protein n=1 Tax=Paenibacillus sp. NEAU-GSW1 TaxID=2682486 RepID=UPI0012E32837|nr:glycosyltransferase family 2 protein [Paenibacillus sp. NEAU-GSW1]MUT68049.1 glycosyltransferase [Paenibacillus sp. NEAU-GSW1]
MKISVVIPTYKRVSTLVECLDGIRWQRRVPDEIVVIARQSDEETLAFLNRFTALNITLVLIEKPGAIAALNAGIGRASGDIIVITDDDTIGHSDWIERIERHYIEDDRLGGLGGKDYVYHDGILERGSADRVGKLMWFGRMIGNHHIGTGNAREADIMKGANMSFRKQAAQGLRLDENLKGNGAQVHWEVGFSLSIKKRGWTLKYDPKVCVDHFPAVRHDEDQRNGFNETAAFNHSHNETYAILSHIGRMRGQLFLLWCVAVGSKPSPGALQYLRAFPRTDMRLNLAKLLIALRGRREGWRTWKHTRG